MRCLVTCQHPPTLLLSQQDWTEDWAQTTIHQCDNVNMILTELIMVIECGDIDDTSNGDDEDSGDDELDNQDYSSNEGDNDKELKVILTATVMRTMTELQRLLRQ